MPSWILAAASSAPSLWIVSFRSAAYWTRCRGCGWSCIDSLPAGSGCKGVKGGRCRHDNFSCNDDKLRRQEFQLSQLSQCRPNFSRVETGRGTQKTLGGLPVAVSNGEKLRN